MGISWSMSKITSKFSEIGLLYVDPYIHPDVRAFHGNCLATSKVTSEILDIGAPFVDPCIMLILQGSFGPCQKFI